eukprot:1176099-Prorocentrum_minimum.AAC.1
MGLLFASSLFGPLVSGQVVQASMVNLNISLAWEKLKKWSETPNILLTRLAAAPAGVLRSLYGATIHGNERRESSRVRHSLLEKWGTYSPGGGRLPRAGGFENPRQMELGMLSYLRPSCLLVGDGLGPAHGFSRSHHRKIKLTHSSQLLARTIFHSCGRYVLLGRAVGRGLTGPACARFPGEGVFLPGPPYHGLQKDHRVPWSGVQARAAHVGPNWDICAAVLHRHLRLGLCMRRLDEERRSPILSVLKGGSLFTP